MNVLALDYGTTNIGMAWKPVGIEVALPFGVIKEKERKKQVEKVSEIVKKEGIDVLVIGLPYSIDSDSKTKNEERIEAFASEVKKQIDIPIVFVDERFSSKQADNIGGNISQDESAAIIILEQYLYRQSLTV